MYDDRILECLEEWVMIPISQSILCNEYYHMPYLIMM